MTNQDNSETIEEIEINTDENIENIADEEQSENLELSLEDQLVQAKSEIEVLKDTALRSMAEAENTRRRAEKDRTEARLYAIDKFARDLLPLADTLGRALTTINDELRANESAKAFIEGIELTEKDLYNTLERHGVKKIGVQGEKFDPNLHQAVAQIPSAIPKDHIAEVFQPGFTLSGRVLRAAMVAVSAGD